VIDPRRSLPLVLVVAALAAACAGGTDEGGGPARLAEPAAFADAVSEPARVTINVHVPDEGSIAGTDLWIPFDELSARADELPDTSTPLAVYCRSGSMSAEAVETLAGLGVTDVVELRGGMLAWGEADRPLLQPGAP
jgi:rhodanese-related sulfurtransferase